MIGKYLLIDASENTIHPIWTAFIGTVGNTGLRPNARRR
jgi:hypothetical protein